VFLVGSRFFWGGKSFSISFLCCWDWTLFGVWFEHDFLFLIFGNFPRCRFWGSQPRWPTHFAHSFFLGETPGCRWKKLDGSYFGNGSTYANFVEYERSEGNHEIGWNMELCHLLNGQSSLMTYDPSTNSVEYLSLEASRLILDFSLLTNSCQHIACASHSPQQRDLSMLSSTYMCIHHTYMHLVCIYTYASQQWHLGDQKAIHPFLFVQASRSGKNMLKKEETRNNEKVTSTPPNIASEKRCRELWMKKLFSLCHPDSVIGDFFEIRKTWGPRFRGGNLECFHTKSMWKSRLFDLQKNVEFPKSPETKGNQCPFFFPPLKANIHPMEG